MMKAATHPIARMMNPISRQWSSYDVLTESDVRDIQSRDSALRKQALDRVVARLHEASRELSDDDMEALMQDLINVLHSPFYERIKGPVAARIVDDLSLRKTFHKTVRHRLEQSMSSGR